MPRRNNRTIRRVDVVELIAVTASDGKGTDEDPHRFIREYWDMNGRRLFVEDPIEQYVKK